MLGTGGDNSNSDIGSFFEGVMTQGCPSDAADNAVQANIVAAGYSGNSAGNAGSSGASAGSYQAAGAAVTHDGYTSVYTVDAANDHLQESYRSNIGNSWATHDLTAMAGTPAVMSGTDIDGTPVALYHTGYTSAYTLDQSDGDLQQTYLSNIGNSWTTQNLTATAKTPVPSQRPAALLHYAANGGLTWTSVFSPNLSNGQLEETYLPAIGDSWTTQDLGPQVTAPTP